MNPLKLRSPAWDSFAWLPWGKCQRDSWCWVHLILQTVWFNCREPCLSLYFGGSWRELLLSPWVACLSLLVTSSPSNIETRVDFVVCGAAKNRVSSAHWITYKKLLRKHQATRLDPTEHEDSDVFPVPETPHSGLVLKTTLLGTRVCLLVTGMTYVLRIRVWEPVTPYIS